MEHTKSEWAWQSFGGQYCLTAQHGKREIILSANLNGDLMMSKDGRLQPVDPEHPNAKVIAAAPELAEFVKHVAEFHPDGNPLNLIQKANELLSKYELKPNPYNEYERYDEHADQQS